jgi:hypothetical protein
VVPFVCNPPHAHLRSWTQVVSLATVYVLVAACVHALAVWGVCNVRKDDYATGSPVTWSIIWSVWIAVVWLPLLGLLTAEHSPWVALVLPVTALFATLLLRWHNRRSEPESAFDIEQRTGFLQLDDAPPLWRVLLPAVLTSAGVQVGVALLAAGHGWESGCLFAAATIYPVNRWLDREAAINAPGTGRSSSRLSAGNSITVWLLMVLALVPFLEAYAASELSGLLGLRGQVVHTLTPTIVPRHASRGYSGIILLAPRKPHEIVAPHESTLVGTSKDLHVIPFDGAYWYFKRPDTRPAPDARVAHGDPLKNRIASTDRDPLYMEAHQPLGKSIAIDCCRSLRINLKNADNVPGTISLEVLLRNTASPAKTTAISLGTLVLPSSAVSPMPLNRAPVEDKLTFLIPRAARDKTFNEITVRIKPERSRSLAGASVSIQDFELQP